MGSYRCCKYPAITTLAIKRLIPLLNLIGERSRLKILSILSVDRHCVEDIVRHTKFSQSLISHHLKDMKNYGVIYGEKIGLRVYYSLTPWGKSIISSLLRIKSKRVIV